MMKPENLLKDLNRHGCLKAVLRMREENRETKSVCYIKISICTYLEAYAHLMGMRLEHDLITKSAE